VATAGRCGQVSIDCIIMDAQKTSTVRRVLLWFGIFWAITGNIERIIGWISGALSVDTEGAVSKISSFIDSVPLIGNPVAQTVMITGGLMILSLSVALWISERRVNKSNRESKISKSDAGSLIPNGMGPFPGKPFASYSEMMSPTIEGRTVFLGDLARISRPLNTIREKVFRNCAIVGPTVLNMVGAVFPDKSCKFQLNDEEPETMLWYVRAVGKKSPMVGKIDAIDCVFINCSFQEVGLAGTPDDIKKLRKLFLILTPLEE